MLETFPSLEKQTTKKERIKQLPTNEQDLKAGPNSPELMINLVPASKKDAGLIARLEKEIYP